MEKRIPGQIQFVDIVGSLIMNRQCDLYWLDSINTINAAVADDARRKGVKVLAQQTVREKGVTIIKCVVDYLSRKK